MGLTDKIGNDESDGSSNLGSSGSSGTSSVTGLYLLPLYIVGIYTFVHKAALLSAAAGLGAWSGVATVAVTAFWIVGVIGVAFIAVFVALNVFAFIGAVVFRSAALLAIAILGLLYHGVALGLGLVYFSQFHIIVAFTLGTSVLIWGGLAVILTIVAILGLGVIGTEL